MGGGAVGRDGHTNNSCRDAAAAERGSQLANRRCLVAWPLLMMAEWCVQRGCVPLLLFKTEHQITQQNCAPFWFWLLRLLAANTAKEA